MLSKSIRFKNYRLIKNKKINKKIKDDLRVFLKEENQILQSLSQNYKNSYSQKLISKLKVFFHIRIIGMGGSNLGAESIYDFLKHKIKKKFYFINNLQTKIYKFIQKKKIFKFNNF